jgi:Zn-dependent protease
MRNPLSLVMLLVMAIYATGEGFSLNNLGVQISEFALRIPALIIGITIHEFAHAKAADMLGDPTPRMQGRVSLNPLRHFDPIGLIALIIIHFGWGKPVMISPENFKNVRLGSFIVSIAGVVTNFIAAVLFSGILAFLWNPAVVWTSHIMKGLTVIVYYIVIINLALMIFNLLPVPPLDGFNILTEILDLRRYRIWYNLYNFGMPILMALIFFGVTGRIMNPALNAVFNALMRLWNPVIYALLGFA